MSNELEFELEVGLEYELSPIIGNKLIGQILAAGGEFFIDGNIIVITSLPGKEAPAPAPAVIVEKKDPTPEPEPEPEPEPIVEEVSASVEVVEELSPSENLAAVEEVVPETKAVSKPRARKVPKTIED